MIDLYGRAPDGRAMLWKHNVPVNPISAFERAGRWIKSGHYVIDDKGDAIVAYCGNTDDGRVRVQFMLNESTASFLPSSVVESMLLGKVVVSDEQCIAFFDGRKLGDWFTKVDVREGNEDEGPRSGLELQLAGLSLPNSRARANASTRSFGTTVLRSFSNIPSAAFRVASAVFRTFNLHY